MVATSATALVWRGIPVWRAAILAACGYCNPAVQTRRHVCYWGQRLILQQYQWTVSKCTSGCIEFDLLLTHRAPDASAPIFALTFSISVRTNASRLRWW